MSASPLTAFVGLIGVLPLLVAVVATAVVITWLLARPLAEGLVRHRVRRLPAPLAERFAEEWAAEADAIERRLGKVAFALALFLTPTRTFVDAVGGPGAVGGNLIVRFDVRVYPTFGLRLLAVIIDDVTGLALVVGLLWSFDLLAKVFAQPTSVRDVIAASMIPIVFHFLMHIVLVVRFGGSPGKLATGLRIVPVQNVPLTYTHAVLRVAPVYLNFLWRMVGATLALSPNSAGGEESLWWMSALPVVMLLWGLADVSTYYASDEGRALHDHLAGTVVVQKGPDVITAADVMQAPKRGLFG